MNPVWIIDDDRSIRWVFEKALTRENIAFKTFATAQEALAVLDTETPQVVVSDIRMPGEINGAQVHKWIQKNQPHLRARIILISGDTANTETQAFLSSSGTPCIEKPFRVQQLISMVEKTFGKP